MRELPVRKSVRLSGYDYSQAGCYFITLCTVEREELFGRISVGAIHESPASESPMDARAIHESPASESSVYPESPKVTLTPAGNIVASVISDISVRYPTATIDNSVIMPNHIHMIVTVREPYAVTRHEYKERAIRESPLQERSLIAQMMGYLKMNVTKRIRGQNMGVYAVWQRSYHDHIIRSEAEYRRIAQYIDENPAKWREDCYYNPKL